MNDSKPSLLFLCDSIGKYLRLNKLCPKHSVTYARTPLIKTAADLINETDPNHSPSTILFHTGTNDLETSDAQAVAHDICHLLTKTSQKFQSSKILFSLFLPRQDNLNAKTHEVNDLIKENIKLLPNVQMIDHTNLHNTKMIVLHDNKHLNRDGLSIFARNLTRTIYKGILVHHESPSSSNSLSRPRSQTESRHPSTPILARHVPLYSEVVRRSDRSKLNQQATGANQRPFDPPHAVKSYSMQSQIPAHSQYYPTTTAMFGNPTAGFPNVPITLTLSPNQLGVLNNQSFYRR